MMQSNETLLDVRPRTHFVRAAKQDANATCGGVGRGDAVGSREERAMRGRKA